MSRGRKLSLLVLAASLLASPNVRAAAPPGAAAVARKLFSRGGREVASESVESLTKRLARIETKHGSKALTTIDDLGVRALNVVEDAGPHGDTALKVLQRHGKEGLWLAGHPKALKLVARHGDEAAEAIIKHPGVAEDLIRKYDVGVARALNEVSPRNARRIGILAEDGTLKAMGRSDELFDVVRRRGDAAMDFIWKHRVVLAGGAALAAFLANPDPYIDGVVKLTDTVGEHATRPMNTMAEGIADGTNWTLLFLLGGGVLVAAIAMAIARRRRELELLSAAALPGRDERKDNRHG